MNPSSSSAANIVVAAPQGAYHASAISIAEYTLRTALPPGWIARERSAQATKGPSRTVWHEFELRPFDFFERNPALDLPRRP